MLEYHLATAHWKASHPIVHSGPLHTYLGINESATFISRFENSHVYTYPSVSNRICPSTRIRIHPSTQTSSWNIGNRAYVLKTGQNRVKSKRKKTWERGCNIKYSIHRKELGSILLRHRKKICISGFSIHTIPYL